MVEQERKVLASKAQRSAIISVLKELGYEVREGMVTAAPHDGKVILRRAANTEMGVEIGGIHGGWPRAIQTGQVWPGNVR